MSVISKRLFFLSRNNEGVDDDFPKKLQEQLSVFKELYPDKIVPVGRKRAFLCNMETLKFELQATPFIEDTWHEQPRVEGSSENGKKSNWRMRMEKDHFPKIGIYGATNAVPKDISGGKAKDMLPVGIKISFAKEDKAYEKFIDGPSLVSKGEVLVQGPFAHGPAHVKVKVDKNVVKIEKFARDALRDCFGVTNMLQMLSKRLNLGMEGGLISENGEAWDTADEMKLTQKWLEIILVSSFRTGAMLQSIQVMAKDSLRDETLDNLHGHSETKRNLRYSHYASDNMFGPLSSDFEPYVSPSSASHEKYKLSPKWGSVGSSSQDKGGFNRSSFLTGSGQNNRGFDSQWDTAKSERSGHSGHMSEERTSYISPQEALRRSRGNNRGGRAGYRNQPFRGKQDQGRRSYQYTKRK